MPDPERLLHTLQRSIEAFRRQPGRQGHLVFLENAREVLVAGDLHGHVGNFRELMTRADLGHHPQRHLVLQEVVHGPYRYPDGGDKSHQLLDLLAALKSQYPTQVHMLLGNHELAQWTNQWIAKGDVDFNDLFRRGVDTAYGSRGEEVYTTYLEMFAAFPLALRTTNRVFLSHSMPSAKRLENFQLSVLEEEFHDGDHLTPGGAIHALVWGRDTRPENVRAFLEKVDADLLITGHIPCEQGYDVPNDRQIILDCMGSPACYCLFPTDRPLTLDELVGCIQSI